MALRDINILWNKLGSNAQSTNSEIGLDFTVNGAPPYVAGKFDTAIELKLNADYLSLTMDAEYNVEKGMLGIWIYCDGWSVTNGVSSDALIHPVFMMGNSTGIPHHTFAFWNAGIYWRIRGNVAQRIWSANIAGLNIAANTWTHITLYWNNNDALKKRQIWLGDSEIANNNLAWGVGSFNTLTLQLGINTVFAWPTWLGRLDNIKIDDDATAALLAEKIANINIEGFIPDAVTGVDASDGTYTTHVQIDWDSIAWVDDYRVYRSTDDVTFTALSDWQVGVTYNDTSAVAGVTYYYEVRARSDGNEGDPSASDSGYRAVRVVDVVCEKTLPQILILSNAIDIYDKVNKIIQVKESKTFRRDKLIVNNISLAVKNFDNYFSVDNPVSIFSNIRWRFDTLKVINQDGETIWDGIIQDILRNHKSKIATIKSVDKLYQFQKLKLSYESDDWETPAESFKNICDQEGFTGYNIKSVQDSINQQEANACRVKCHFGKDDDITFQQALEKLGEVGCADVYTHKNEIYYQHWQVYTGGVKVNLTENEIETAPAVSSGIKDIINDYRIGYEGDDGTPTTDSDNNEIGSVSRDTYGTHELPEMDCSTGQEIVFESLAAAVYIGECYIRRTHKNIDVPNTIPTPLTIINFDIKETQPDWIDLRTYFSLTLSDEAWDEKIFEIFGTTINYDNNKIKMLAYEVN